MRAQFCGASTSDALTTLLRGGNKRRMGSKILNDMLHGFDAIFYLCDARCPFLKHGKQTIQVCRSLTLHGCDVPGEISARLTLTVSRGGIPPYSAGMHGA